MHVQRKCEMTGLWVWYRSFFPFTPLIRIDAPPSQAAAKHDCRPACPVVWTGWKSEDLDSLSTFFTELALLSLRVSRLLVNMLTLSAIAGLLVYAASTHVAGSCEHADSLARAAPLWRRRLYIAEGRLHSFSACAERVPIR